MSGTFTSEQTSDEAVDLRGAGAEPAGAVTAARHGVSGLDRSFVVTIKTPAGHEHGFRVSGEQRVETVTARAVADFVKHGELVERHKELARKLTEAQAELAAERAAGEALRQVIAELSLELHQARDWPPPGT